MVRYVMRGTRRSTYVGCFDFRQELKKYDGMCVGYRLYLDYDACRLFLRRRN